MTMPRKLIGVAGDPVRHVAAERPAHQRGPLGVEVVALERGVDGRDDVGERLGAPTAPPALDEGVAVAGRDGRVGHEHRVARAASSCGFQRQLHAFHEPIGPPCTNTTSGLAPSASRGVTSHEPISWPSPAAAPSRRAAREAARASSSSSGNERIRREAPPSVAERRTGLGPARNAMRGARSPDPHLERRSETSRHRRRASSNRTQVVAVDSRGSQRSAVNQIEEPSGALAGGCGRTSRSGVGSRPLPFRGGRATASRRRLAPGRRSRGAR